MVIEGDRSFIKAQYCLCRCVFSGGSEVNSGLYHRTCLSILKRWKEDFQLQYAEPHDLEPHFIACEQRLSVEKMLGNFPPSSLKLLRVQIN